MACRDWIHCKPAFFHRFPERISQSAPPVSTSERAELEAVARAAALRQGIDPALVFAVIDVESDWNPSAVSKAGAIGLMQLLPATARELGVRDLSRLVEPELNLQVGTTHLRRLLGQFCDPRLALWAWHAGERPVDLAADEIRAPESARFVEMVLARYAERRVRTGGSAVATAYPRTDCGTDPVPSGARIPAGGESPDEQRASASLAPVASISHAWISDLQVRIGDPLEFRIAAVNQGGPARRGAIVLQLLEHPRLRIVTDSGLSRVRLYRPGDTYALPGGQPAPLGNTLIEASTEGWAPGEEHALVVRLIPQDTGEISLAYSLLLEGERGGLSIYPAGLAPGAPLGRSAKVVKVLVTRTLAWRQP
jgi:hypothetical protein